MRNYLVNFLVCFFLYLLSISNIYASHAAGMDISYECISQDTTFDIYKVIVRFYRDCNNTAAPGSIDLDYSSSCGFGSATMPLVSGPIYITPSCTGSGTPCSGSSLVELEEYQYEKLITLDHCDDWLFTTCVNARNNAITTINQPANQALCVRAEINNLNVCNNSPDFTEYPAPYICVNEPFCYNNGAIDIDGDSLVYSLETPLSSINDTVEYLSGFSSVNPISGTTTFDPSSGNLCMTANSLQVSIVAMKISEYRNGVFIGSVIRDIQIIILTCSTIPPVLSGFNGFPQDVTNSSAMDDSLNLCVDESDTISFTIDAQLGSSNNKIMSWSGIPTSSNASFTITNNFSNNPIGTFNWIPQISDVQNSPFTFNVTVQDDACPINNVFSYTYTITLSSSSTFITSYVVNDETCYGSNDGSINVTINGTDSIPHFDWIGPNGYVNINEDINSLSSGLYNLLITDISGCFMTDSLFVTSPNPYSVSYVIDSVSCTGFNDGAIDLSITGNSGFFTYNWIGPNGFLSTNEDINLLFSGDYSLSISDSSGCVYYDTINIIEPNPFNASYNISDISCNSGNDGAIDLSVSGNTSTLLYNWTGPNGFTSSNQDINLLSHGDYYITITNNNGCIFNDSIFMSDPLPLTSLSSVSTCYSYFWNGTIHSNSGTYSWSGFNSNGCDSTATLNLIIYDSSSVNLSAVACDNYFWNNILYSSSGIYLWQGTTLNGCDSLVYLNLVINEKLFNEVEINSCSYYNWNGVIYSESGLYIDTLIHSFGCDSIVELSLFVSDFSFSATSPICENDSTEINIFINNPTSNQYDILINNYTFPYSFIVDSTGLLVSNGNPIKIKLNQDANFTFKSANDFNNCIATPNISTNVIVNALPDLNIYLGDICDNSGSFFLSQAEPLGGIFSIDNQITDSLFPGNITLGSHTLSYYYIDSNTNCSNNIEKEILILEAPTADMLIYPQSTQIDSLITFTNISSNFVSSSWNLGNNYSISGVSEFTYSYSEFGQYLVELSVIGSNNCIDITSNYINVYPTYSVYIPNSFSPDSDMINESFYPMGIGILSYDIIIFDRWGGVVFNQTNTPWLADDIAQGVYTYIINMLDYNDQTYQYTGTVRIIR